MENLPANKDQYNHWPEPLKQVQLARTGEFFKDLHGQAIAALCKMIANERGLNIEDMDRTVTWLKNHFPHIRPKQFTLAFELYDARKLPERTLKAKAFKLFTKEFIGIVLDGFKEYQQVKMREVVLLEQKEKNKSGDEDVATPEQREHYLKVLGEIKKGITDKYGDVKKKKPIVSVHELRERKNNKKK